MESYLDIVGRIFDIQKYSIHDGPGIRTIVFLKGCPLRCKWCCNPEGQEFPVQQMNFGDSSRTVGEDITVRKIMEEVKKDLPYYMRSGGGLTLSGGECLAQPEFAAALLRAAKESGISTAIETTGFARWEYVENCLKYTDYVMMDIKNMNSDKHKRFCGQPNEVILENARKIACVHTGLTVRVPVIPTFNDTETEIQAIAEFAASLKTVKHFHLLPYHRLGTDKYRGLNREYLLDGLELVPDEKLSALLRTAQKSGLECQIGG